MHYLKTVMRRPDASQLRVFNERYGEWLGQLAYQGKKDGAVHLQSLVQEVKPRPQKLHLLFALIKKDRQDFLIEKAVELGVTDLRPLLSHNTVIRDLNGERTKRQIIEAAEQTERLDLPVLHHLVSLEQALRAWPADIPLYAAIERNAAPLLASILPVPAEAGLLIGPEGGFSEDERALLCASKKIQPVSLGAQILRAETAGLFGLSLLSGNFRP